LCQAVIKHDRFDYAVQKCTEIGVKKIVPFLSERCVKRPKSEDNFVSRSKRIALEAAKQCGRSLVPEIGGVRGIKDLPDIFGGALVIMAYEKEAKTGLKGLLKGYSGKDIVVIVGPEGGFTVEEAEMLTGAGARAASRGKLILRAETAGVAACAMVMYEYGE
jgi:16S rRNA (uracil1498-N3)-methyltransferase